MFRRYFSLLMVILLSGVMLVGSPAVHAGTAVSRIFYVSSHDKPSGSTGYSLMGINSDGTNQTYYDDIESNYSISPDNQFIAFAKDFSANNDGSDLKVVVHNLSNMTSHAVYDLAFVNDSFHLIGDWSPDSTRFLISDVSNGTDVYSVKSDGTDKKLVFDDVFNVSASWSPDGRKIMVVKQGGAIVTANSDGSGQQVWLREVQISPSGHLTVPRLLTNSLQGITL